MAYHSMVSHLVELGLNRYEATIYITLVSDGISTAKNISEMTGIPYGKIYEIFSNLSKKGFVTILPTKPMKAKAIPPEEAMANVRRSLDSRYQQVEKMIVEELSPQYAMSGKFNDPHALFWIIRGRSNINYKIDQLIKKASTNIHINTSVNGLKRSVIFKESLTDARKKGIDIRISSVISKENAEDVKSLGFCQIKHIDTSPNHFYSIDNKECMIVDSLPDDDNITHGRDIGIWVESPSFTTFIENFFMGHFNQAQTAEAMLKKLRAG